jgi:hypothetical protein
MRISVSGWSTDVTDAVRAAEAIADAARGVRGETSNFERRTSKED